MQLFHLIGLTVNEICKSWLVYLEQVLGMSDRQCLVKIHSRNVSCLRSVHKGMVRVDAKRMKNSLTTQYLLLRLGLIRIEVRISTALDIAPHVLNRWMPRGLPCLFWDVPSLLCVTGLVRHELHRR